MNEFESFLCNEPLRPELAENIWFLIETKGSITKEALYERYGRKDTQKDVDYALRLLHLLKIIEPTKRGFVIINIPDDINKIIKFSPHGRFRLLVLNRLRIMSGDSSSYNQQAHVLLTYRILSEQEIGMLRTDETATINLINREWGKNKYLPQSAQGQITLNELKFGYWKELAVFLGLVYPGPRLKQFMVSISPQLSRDMALLFLMTSDQIAKRNEAPIKDFVDFLQDRFLYVEIITKGTFPNFNKVIEGMLLSLENLGIFTLIKEGDSPIYELPMRRSTGMISTKVNNLRINPNAIRGEEYNDLPTLSSS